jgi:tRNA 2-(methylsulfanyl)-N6-isopentenyladenosine37 hydroxylase
MLHLLVPTDPSWASAAESDLDALLMDHAHCELKAANAALSLIARYAGELPNHVDALVALAREETAHFHEVHTKLTARGNKLGLPRVDEYVALLRAAARSDHKDHPVLLDRLLVSALIEARSCERFQVLSEHLASSELRSFYRALMVSEARHYRLFYDLASERFGEAETRSRLESLALREANVAGELPLGPTVHG